MMLWAAWDLSLWILNRVIWHIISVSQEYTFKKFYHYVIQTQNILICISANKKLWSGEFCSFVLVFTYYLKRFRSLANETGWKKCWKGCMIEATGVGSSRRLRVDYIHPYLNLFLFVSCDTKFLLTVLIISSHEIKWFSFYNDAKHG